MKSTKIPLLYEGDEREPAAEPAEIGPQSDPYLVQCVSVMSRDLSVVRAGTASNFDSERWHTSCTADT